MARITSVTPASLRACRKEQNRQDSAFCAQVISEMLLPLQHTTHFYLVAYHGLVAKVHQWLWHRQREGPESGACAQGHREGHNSSKIDQRRAQCVTTQLQLLLLCSGGSGRQL